MDATFWVALFGFLGTCVVTVRMGMSYWFRQSEKIEKLKDENNKNTVGRLDAVIDSLKKDLGALGRKVSELEDLLTKHGIKLTDNTNLSTEAMNLIKSYMRQNEQRFQALESTQVALGKDLVLIKGKNGGAGNK